MAGSPPMSIMAAAAASRLPGIVNRLVKADPARQNGRPPMVKSYREVSMPPVIGSLVRLSVRHPSAVVFLWLVFIALLGSFASSLPNVVTGMLWCLGIAAFAARPAGRIRQSANVMAWINCVLGGLFAVSASASRCWRRRRKLVRGSRFSCPPVLRNSFAKGIHRSCYVAPRQLRRQLRKRIAAQVEAENDHADLEPAPKDIRLRPCPYRPARQNTPAKGRRHGNRAGSAVAPVSRRRRRG